MSAYRGKKWVSTSPAVADRLRDDHGYELTAKARQRASETANTYRLHPTGCIVVDKADGVLTVNLHGLNVDADDLFTAVSSDVEQRHDGLGVEIWVMVVVSTGYTPGSSANGAESMTAWSQPNFGDGVV